MRILIILSIALLTACADTSDYKYKVGDIVYLKPDSTKGVISSLDNNRAYIVKIGYNSGFFANNIEHVAEEEIYGK